MCSARRNDNCPLGVPREMSDIQTMTRNAPPSSRATRLEATLRAAFAPTILTITDDSARHAGHAGAKPGGGTHFSVLVVSAAFHGQNRIARHRIVNAALAAELASGLHALALVLRTPDEHSG
jgi:stress-induced morphogen